MAKPAEEVIDNILFFEAEKIEFSHLNILPITHICDDLDVGNILDKKEITPKPCKVFDKEKLSYFFYGKPSYDSDDISSPCVFAFALEKKISPVRISPFDSGALKKELYGIKNRHPEIFCNPENNSFENTRKIIAQYFKDNSLYYDGDPLQEVSKLTPHGNAVYKIYSNYTTEKYDLRANTVEIQLNNPFKLKDHKLIYFAMGKGCEDWFNKETNHFDFFHEKIEKYFIPNNKFRTKDRTILRGEFLKQVEAQYKKLNYL